MDEGGRPAPVAVRVMVFNVEDGGDGVDLRKVAEAIRVVGADVVLLQEAWGNAGRIAELVGFGSVSVRTQVIARHPIHDVAEGAADPVLVEVTPGRVIAVASVHLPADPYGPELAARGARPGEVDALEERVRLPRLVGQLAAAHDLKGAGIPVVIGGDFNAPSHLDRTDAAWPVSRAIEAAGFADAWRSAHPDPAADPGPTWPAARPATGGYEPPADAPADRIDMLFAGGPATVVGCRLAGELGRPDVAWAVDPWPSDHRAVVLDLETRPAPLGWAGGQWRPVDELARPPLDAACVRLTLARPLLRVGEPIEVAWTGGPAYRWDWVAVFEASAAEGPSSEMPRLGDRHLLWAHTGARASGSLVLDAGAAEVDQSPVGGRWPLAPGRYVVAYLLDDSPRILGWADLTIAS